MRKSNRGSMQARPEMTVGIDLGDRFSRYCMVNGDGEVIEEGRMRTTGAALERHFAGEARQRIALECGTHSPWVSRLLQEMGHEVVVANTRKLRAITHSESKNAAMGVETGGQWRPAREKARGDRGGPQAGGFVAPSVAKWRTLSTVSPANSSPGGIGVAARREGKMKI